MIPVPLLVVSLALIATGATLAIASAQRGTISNAQRRRSTLLAGGAVFVIGLLCIAIPVGVGILAR